MGLHCILRYIGQAKSVQGGTKHLARAGKDKLAVNPHVELPLRFDLRHGYLEPDIKTRQSFMQFGYYNGVQGNVTTNLTDRNIIPYYKGTWANIRRVGGQDDFRKSISLSSSRALRAPVFFCAGGRKC
jgi:hypothetical protein